MTQGGDEGLGAPMAERRAIDQALPAGGPARGPGHVGLDRRLVYESQSFRMVGHEGLALGDPDVAQGGDVLALLFKRLKIFFYASDRARAVPAGRRPGDPRCRGCQPVLQPVRRA